MLFTAIARVSAENYDNYTPVNGDDDKFYFTKYLVLNAGSEVPDTEFTFKITSGQDNPGTATTVKQIAGIEPDKISVKAYPGTSSTDVVQGNRTPKSNTTVASNEFKVIFSSNDEATATNGEKAVNPHGGEIAAKKDILFDFSAIAFPEPGVYRYIIEETNTSNKDVSMDTKKYRTLDVYVIDDGTGTLEVEEYVFYENDLGTTAADKDSEFDALDKFDISASGIRNETWTELKDVVYTYTYDQDTQKWNAAGSPAKTGEISVPGSATCDEVEHDYERARNNGIDVTRYQWKNTEQVSYVYTWNETNEYWQDNYGRTNLTVPSNASNGTTTYGEFYEAKFNEQKAAWDAEKHDDVVSYPNGNGAEAGTKTDKYVNKYLRYNLIVKKQVEGNQGSKDQFFKFTVVLESDDSHKGAVIDLEMPNTLDSAWKNNNDKPNTATTYTKGVIYEANSRDDDPNELIWNNATNEQRQKYRFTNPTDDTKWAEWNGTQYVNESGQTASGHGEYVYHGKNGQQIVLNNEGKATVTLYLQDKEQAKFINLPQGVKYSVNEEESNKDGYKTTGEVKTLTELVPVIMTYSEVSQDNNLKIQDYEYMDSNGDEYYMGQNGWMRKPADGSPASQASEVPSNATTTVYTTTVKVVNERSGVIPTGVFVAAGTGFAILGVGIVGMLALSRRKEEDEEE